MLKPTWCPQLQFTNSAEGRVCPRSWTPANVRPYPRHTMHDLRVSSGRPNELLSGLRLPKKEVDSNNSSLTIWRLARTVSSIFLHFNRVSIPEAAKNLGVINAQLVWTKAHPWPRGSRNTLRSERYRCCSLETSDGMDWLARTDTANSASPAYTVCFVPPDR